jgi:hypothetical protein
MRNGVFAGPPVQTIMTKYPVKLKNGLVTTSNSL